MDDAEKERMKSSAEPLIAALTSAGTQFKGRACKCPFCDDKHPSAGIFEKEGKWFYKCHKCGFGGDIFDVRAQMEGKTPADVLRELGGPSTRHTARSAPRRKPTEPAGDDCPAPDLPAAAPPPRSFASLDEAKKGISHLSETYVYTNPKTGKGEMYVFRIQPPGEHKRFLQGKPGNNGDIILQAPEKPWPIYNRKRISASKHILCAEGEKAVHALSNFVTATTSPGGAGKAAYADWTPLAGKNVYLWPDNDEPNEKGARAGIEHMRQVHKILEKLNPPPLVYWINPDDLDLPAKGDAVEFLAKYPDDAVRLEQVQAVMANAEPLGASAGVKARFEDAISGKRETIIMPWKMVHEATMALKPGTVTLLCGEGGAAKSFALLQLCAFWHFDLGKSLAIYELEDDREYHLTRALAQLTGESGLMHENWLRDNPDLARKLHHDNAEFLDRMGQMIFEAPTNAVTLSQLAQWVDEQAAAGKRIICIDPITAAEVGKNSWLEDQTFLISVKKSIVEHGCSLVLVTHPRKGGSQIGGMDNLAGGACWARFSQTILWLKTFSAEKEVMVHGEYTTEPKTCNRNLCVLKARNAPDGNRNFAMNLERLKLVEIGAIMKKPRGKRDD